MTTSPLTLDVALAPSLLASGEARQDTVYVVIDVVRATTTLCRQFECGVGRVLLAPGRAEALAARERLGSDYLLAGEVGGARPPGFDLGNSPSELAGYDLRGHNLIFATTNGTGALRACSGGRATFAGAFRNATAVTHAALAVVGEAQAAAPSPFAASTDDAAHPEAADVVFVCSGRGGRPAYDDTLCAGYLAAALVRAASESGRASVLGEGARIALAVWREVERSGDLHSALASSDAGRAIAAIGLEADLDACAAVDATDLVPALMGTFANAGVLLEVAPWRAQV